MEKKEYFLGQGKYTKRDKVVKEALKKVLTKEKKTDFGKVSLFLKEDLTFRKRGENEPFSERNRTASKVISSGIAKGCNDYGAAFLALIRELGVPAKHIETFQEDWLKNPRGTVQGHVFVDIFLDGKWKKYEPKTGFCGEDYDLNGKKYIKVGEGIDRSEIYLIDKNFKLKNKKERIDKIKIGDVGKYYSNFLFSKKYTKY